MVFSKIFFENMLEKVDFFYWDFGDGNIFLDFLFVYCYWIFGNYVVSLKVMKEGKMKGRVKEECLVIDVLMECFVEIEMFYGDMFFCLYDDMLKY